VESNYYYNTAEKESAHSTFLQKTHEPARSASNSIGMPFTFLNMFSDVTPKPTKGKFITNENVSVSQQQQIVLKEKARSMFYNAYNAYIANAFPMVRTFSFTFSCLPDEFQIIVTLFFIILKAELKPLSCSGGDFDLIKIPMVTLFDALDALVILGNYSEFRRVVSVLDAEFPSFNLDVNISVFETTIRVLGGLLSAHLLAVDPKSNVYEVREESKIFYAPVLIL
jgi:hypothetical protein